MWGPAIRADPGAATIGRPRPAKDPAMSMKKTDLEKNKAKKIDGSMRAAVIPDRNPRANPTASRPPRAIG